MKLLNIFIIGDNDVGKTTYIRNCSTSHKCIRKSINGIETTEIPWNNQVTFKCWNISKDIDFNKIKVQIPKPDGIILIFDCTNRRSYDNIKKYYSNINKDIPIILCGNKMDCKNQAIESKEINFHRNQDKHIQYYYISGKIGFNCEKPFNYLTKKLIEN